MKSGDRHDNLKLVKNDVKYHEFIRRLRNDENVRAGFIRQGYVSRRQQAAYMRLHGRHYFVCLLDGAPAGYVGVVDGDIRVATLPELQGGGVGLFMIRSLLKRRKRLQAKIKVDNAASIGLFEKAGFKLKYYIYEP